MIDQDSIVVRNNDRFISSDLGTEVVLLDLSSGNYISMNVIGALIWKVLEKSESVSNLITMLIAKTDVTEDQCRKETISFLTDLYEQEIIKLHS